MLTGTTILSAIKETVDPATEVVYEENPIPEFMKANNFSYSRTQLWSLESYLNQSQAETMRI